MKDEGEWTAGDRLFGVYVERLNGGGVLVTQTRDGDAARGSYIRQAFTSPKLFREAMGRLSNELFDD